MVFYCSFRKWFLFMHLGMKKIEVWLQDGGLVFSLEHSVFCTADKA